VQEKIEAQCKESRAADAKSVKEHSDKLKELNERIDHKFKHALAYGSMSLWTKEERDKIEDARHDPVEAMAAMTKHMKERAKTYKDQQREMADRVGSVPPLNIDKQRWQEIEVARQDPEEAKQRIESQLKQRKDTFMVDRKAMKERVKAIRPTSFRAKEERDRIEELRQDPDEAAETMQKHLSKLARNYQEEQAAMTDRVWSRPCESSWTRDEWAAIEEARQDPQEAQQKAKLHMQRLAQSYKEHQETIGERVKVRPPLNIRTREDRARIEEARHDPDEARESAKAHMKELNRTYQEHKRQIHDRVHANPLVTFRSPRAQEIVARKILKDLPMK